MEHDIPYGYVQVRCKDCQQTFFVRAKDLKKKVQKHNGYYPCDKCGSFNTTWEFRTEHSA